MRAMKGEDGRRNEKGRCGWIRKKKGMMIKGKKEDEMVK